VNTSDPFWQVQNTALRDILIKEEITGCCFLKGFEKGLENKGRFYEVN
jgi:hypothetical protein